MQFVIPLVMLDFSLSIVHLLLLVPFLANPEAHRMIVTHELFQVLAHCMVLNVDQVSLKVDEWMIGHILRQALISLVTLHNELVHKDLHADYP